MSVTQGYDQPECWVTPLNLEEGALALLYPTLMGQEAASVLLCSEHSSSLPLLGRGQDAVCLERLAGGLGHF